MTASTFLILRALIAALSLLPGTALVSFPISKSNALNIWSRPPLFRVIEFPEILPDAFIFQNLIFSFPTDTSALLLVSGVNLILLILKSLSCLES